MVTAPQTTTGITYDVHIRKPDDGIQKFEGVLDVMKLPNKSIKFHHNGELEQFSDGEIIRCRVSNAEDAFKYVCTECESEESALITGTDFGEDLVLGCPVCKTVEPFDRNDL